MRIGVIGAGALGTFYGSRLQAAGNEVHLVARSDAEHGKRHGFTCRSPLGDEHIAAPFIHDSPTTLPPCDVIIVAIKTTENHLFAHLLPPAMTKHNKVLVLQNGLGVEAEAAAVVGADKVWGGLCFVCANKIGPGLAEHMAHGKVTLGMYHQDGLQAEADNDLKALAQEFIGGGIDIELSSNLAEARWRKLCWNIPYNGLCTVLNVDTDRLRKCPQGRQAVQTLMCEVQQGAAACGHIIDDDFLALMVRNTDEMGPYLPSMTIDRRLGRAMEVEHMFGKALKIAAANGRELPQIKLIWQQLRVIQNS